MGEKTPEELLSIGKKTQFGQPDGPDPVEAAKKSDKGSARASIRKIAGYSFDMSPNALPLPVQIKRLFDSKEARLSGAQILAIRKFEQAMTSDRAMDTMIEHIDGKQIERKVEATVTLADLVAGSYQIDAE